MSLFKKLSGKSKTADKKNDGHQKDKGIFGGYEAAPTPRHRCKADRKRWRGGKQIGGVVNHKARGMGTRLAHHYHGDQKAVK